MGAVAIPAGRTKDGGARRGEKMYQRALQGYEKAWGPGHTSILITVNNLGNLYADQGKLDEAEEMYRRALQSYENTYNLEHTSVRNALSGRYEIYCRRGVSLRQEQRAHRQANLAHHYRDTIVAVANLCEKLGAVWPSFFSILGRMLI